LQDGFSTDVSNSKRKVCVSMEHYQNIIFSVKLFFE
jgi:hypothetical protein